MSAEAKTDTKASVQNRAATLLLRKASLGVLTAAMKQMIAHAYTKRAHENRHLTQQQWDHAMALRFDQLDGVIIEAAYARDRPQVRIDELQKKKFYCSVVAYHWKIKKILHPDEKQWASKTVAWWESHYPLEYEVSHLYDGTRRDINPNNLTYEAHDLNKSRAFCRLLYEKQIRDGASQVVALGVATSTCALLHAVPCKYAGNGGGVAAAADAPAPAAAAAAAADNTDSKHSSKRARKA